MSYDSDIKALLGEIKGKMDMCLSNQDRMFDRVDHLDSRLRQLEAHKAYTLGVIAAISLIWVVAVEWIKGKIQVG